MIPDTYFQLLIDSTIYLISNVLVDAVEIPADPDMVHANQISNVIYVLRHVRDAGLRSAFHEIIVKCYHHQPAVISLETSNMRIGRVIL